MSAAVPFDCPARLVALSAAACIASLLEMSSYHLMSSKETIIHVYMCLFNIGKFHRSEKLTWYKTGRCSCGKVGPRQPSPPSLLEDLLHILFVVCLAGLQANMGISIHPRSGV